MGESDIASMAERLADASPREVHHLVLANPWLLDRGLDNLIGDLLITTRRRGDGPRAERLERGRLILRRCREYGADRVLVRDVLDRLETLSPTELGATLEIVPGDVLQTELRRRIDWATDIGDILLWEHWVTVSIALKHAGGPDPLPVAAPPDGAARSEVERDAEWAAEFLDEYDPERQRAMLGEGPLPLPQSRLEQVRLRVRFEYRIAAFEWDALAVIRLRWSLALAQVAAAADENPELAEEVLAGRQVVFAEGYVV